MKWVERHPDDWGAYGCLNFAYARKGKQKEATEPLDRRVSLSGFPKAAKRIRQTFATSGFKAAKRQLALELENLAATKKAYLPASTASVFAEVGDKERAYGSVRVSVTKCV